MQFLAFFVAKMTKFVILDQKLIVPNDYQQFWVHFDWFLSLFQMLDVKYLFSLFNLVYSKIESFSQILSHALFNLTCNNYKIQSYLIRPFGPLMDGQNRNVYCKIAHNVKKCLCANVHITKTMV